MYRSLLFQSEIFYLMYHYLRAMALRRLFHRSIDRHFRGAAVFITDPEKKDIISTKGMQALFEFTDAEAEVCALFAEGLSPNDIAESRNTNLSTVRGQIKTLYSKTGTSGHASLVRLALKVNLPVTRKEG